jgi:hypothetical protein
MGTMGAQSNTVRSQSVSDGMSIYAFDPLMAGLTSQILGTLDPQQLLGSFAPITGELPIAQSVVSGLDVLISQLSEASNSFLPQEAGVEGAVTGLAAVINDPLGSLSVESVTESVTDSVNSVLGALGETPENPNALIEAVGGILSEVSGISPVGEGLVQFANMASDAVTGFVRQVVSDSGLIPETVELGPLGEVFNALSAETGAVGDLSSVVGSFASQISSGAGADPLVAPIDPSRLGKPMS